ncbi:MAG TPA: sugar ABC transporter permease [Streptosporangiaceae bacterium]|jgi:raffinose/stachyose/melibiose transport system permease protein|nr:sugar ABC transporter permease [Streptosporangiaceae bacterium]
MVKARQLVVYLGPAVVFALAFIVFPLIFVIVLSFTQWAGIGPAKYIGIQNYTYLFKDPAFRSAIYNTLLWVAAGIFVQTPLCLLTALIISRRPFMWKFFRTALFIPSVVSTTILALMWYFMLDPTVGLVNGTLNSVGLKSLTRTWLSDPSTAQWAIMVPFVIYIGFGMVLFLTQISTIPRELLEAAHLDGANVWQQDFFITIPAIRRAIALWILFLVGYVLKMFEYPFVMTDGGPVNVTMNLPLYVYNQMVTANAYGLAMAAGVVTVVLGALLMLVVLLGLRWMESR